MAVDVAVQSVEPTFGGIKATAEWLTGFRGQQAEAYVWHVW